MNRLSSRFEALEKSDKANQLYVDDYICGWLQSYVDGFQLDASLRTVVENWELFRNKLLSLIDLHMPLVKIRGDANNLWFTNSLRKLVQKKWLFRAGDTIATTVKMGRYLECQRGYINQLNLETKTFYHNDVQKNLETDPLKSWKNLTTKKKFYS